MNYRKGVKGWKASPPQGGEKSEVFFMAPQEGINASLGSQPFLEEQGLIIFSGDNGFR